MTARRIVVVDLETTSVDPDRAVPLEIAAVEYKPDAPARRGQVVEYVPPWNPHVLAAADPVALAVNRYYERRVFERTVPPEDAAAAEQLLDPWRVHPIGLGTVVGWWPW